ncbi:S9 family peptidase [Telmatocola sphagniphila]|uniref:S9 family peptidase n=1 Tax=Telmatocola sphagniphila TaxID=1123043 RepID=A0A8E6EUI8_9BACT|nr:S9 family peptidase [Telmatocola sphagniphila]QVL31327.1 S9 family peptidase [Telmatocola sphagniphila]
MIRLLMALCVFGGLMVEASAAEKRPLQIDDLFKLKRVADPQISPDGKYVVYQVTEILDADKNKKQTHLWLAASDGKTPPRQLTSSGKSDTHPRWSPDGKKILFESSRAGTPQLYVLDLSGGEAVKITDISSGAGNAIWSPDASKIAFMSAVYPEFSELPFTESNKKNQEKSDGIDNNIVKAKVFTKLFFRHWDEYVGDKRNHLFVIDADGKNCRDVTPGDRDAYPNSTTFSVGDDFVFSPDGKYLVFAAVPEKNESWSTNYDLCRVSLDNKSTNWENLTKDNPAADNCPRFSPDGKKLAYRAQKKPGYEADKWDILVVDVKPDGTFAGKPENVTSSLDRSFDSIVWLKDSTTILTDGNDNGATAIWDVYTREKTLTKLIEGGQMSSVGVSNDGNKLVFAQSKLNHPNKIVVTSTLKGAESGTVTIDANATLLASLDLPRPESVSVDVEGGKMQMWILKPPGFDPSKKWPVVYLVHGGPQGAWEDGWSNRWNPEIWAAQGYVIALPNPRGSTGFGQKFCDEISGDWGGKCYRDLVAGLEVVKKLPYVDKDRMGSAGASFGGYMQDWFAVNEISKEFKCLITHCSVYNFESMWGTTDELWFDEYEHGGLPWEIPGKYREYSPHTRAQNLGKYKTPMLIIHNDYDFRCPIGQGLELFSALQRQGVPSRFVNFPDEGHWVLKPANSKYWHKEVFAWLTKYAPPGGK